MARSIATIYNAIISEKETKTELSGLLPAANENMNNLLADIMSGSKVAVWRGWAAVTAVAIWVLEKLFDAHKNEVNTLIAKLTPETIRWYHGQSIAFQYGDNLYWINNKWQYEAADESKQIIKRCAANANDEFKWELNKDATPLDNVSARQDWTSDSVYRTAHGDGIISLTANQYVWLSVKNYSGTGDLTMNNININLRRQ